MSDDADDYTLHDEESDCENCTVGKYASSTGVQYCKVCAAG